MEQTAETVRPTPETAPESRPQPTSPSPLPSSERDLRWRSASRSPGFRSSLIVIVIVLLVARFFLWRYFTSYESTDDGLERIVPLYAEVRDPAQVGRLDRGQEPD